jgi:hypothetical protein
MKAKILEVIAVNPNENPGDGDSSYAFKVYEFSNGLIQVPCDTTHDYFFDSKENIQCNGTDVVKERLETGEFIDISVEMLEESIKGSEEEFGVESVPQNAYELIHNANK